MKRHHNKLQCYRRSKGRQFSEILLHRPIYVRRKGHCAQRIIWAKVQRKQGLWIRASTRTHVIDGIRRMGGGACRASKTERHSVVNVHEVGASKFAGLILEDKRNSIMRHGKVPTKGRQTNEDGAG
jgi:hypothetical protein